MNTTRINKFYIEQSSFVVTENGIMATFDHTKYFPIDGLICHASPSDVEELDTIKPYQISENGLSTYFTVAQPTAANADGNAGAASEDYTTDSCTGYDELIDDEEDVRNFIGDIEHSAKGCLLFLLASLAIVGLGIFIGLKSIL